MLNVTVSGVLIDTSTFKSKKNGKDVNVAVIYCSGELAKVYDIPPELLPDLYTPVDVPCKLYEGKNGVGFVYAK